MIQDYTTHLAAAILNDERIVSYRLLSRELKIHGNTAKRMLYDFHKKQNAKTAGSVHATYLLDGAPKVAISESQANGQPLDGEDAHMQSSPFVSSAAQQENWEEEVNIHSRSLILAREEDLEAAKSRLETVHSIHIYSLQPGTIQNLQALSDCNGTISTTFHTEDPMMAGPQYGIIHNAGVRRRTARRPLGTAPLVAVAKKAEISTPMSTAQALDLKKEDSKTGALSSQQSTKTETRPVIGPSSKAVNKPPPLKKEGSNIFKSFSKSTMKLKREDTNTPAAESRVPASQDRANPTEDKLMTGMSEDEQGDDLISENKADPKANSARSERAEKLRLMMDDDDEEEVEDADNDESLEASQESNAIIEITPQREHTPNPAPIVSGGRRRGRRKVMKKKTIKDEEGYLVTKEEPAWESFSEDEPVPQKERAPMSSSAASLKAKKTGGAKPGQGNIMTFFGKK